MRCLLALLVAVVVGVSAFRQERTPPTRCVPPNPCFPSRQMIAEFAANITGNVYQPSDENYLVFVTKANGRAVSHPAIIVVVATESDVQTAVLFARQSHLMLSVDDGATDYSRGFLGDASLVINLSQLNSVSTAVDVSSTEAGSLTAQSGARWTQLYDAAVAVNRDVVAASWLASAEPIPSETQAGGISPISRSLGLIADNLLSARLVMMDGTIVDVSAAGATKFMPNGVTRRTTVDPGLWRAVRGGGAGSFGIPVSYTFQLHLRPSYVTQLSATYVMYKDEQFIGRDTLKFLLPFIYSLPNEWGGSIFLSGVASASTVGEKGTISVELVHYGEYNSASFLAANDLINYDQTLRLSFSVQNRTSVDNFLENVQRTPPSYKRAYAFNTLLPESVLTDSDKLDDLVDYLLIVLSNPTVDSHYLCSLMPLGGAISTANSTGYVTSALRNAAYSLDCALRWSDDDAIRDNKMLPYIITLGHHLKAFGTGTYMGLGLFEDEENWKVAMYGDHYQDLMRVKMTYDVDNFLWCHNCVGSDFKLNCRNGPCAHGRRGRDSHEDDSHEDDSSEEDSHERENHSQRGRLTYAQEQWAKHPLGVYFMHRDDM